MSAPLVFLPVLGAPVLHAPVLRWDLLKPLKRPISARRFGANKTWRGALLMTAGPVAATVLAFRVPAYRRRLPPAVERANPLVVGGLLGTAVWVGELPNSFLKRRMDIAPGMQRRGRVGVALIVLDQADLVPGVWLCLAPVYVLPVATAAVAFVAVAAVHFVINVIGYAIGARSSPL